MVWSIERMLLLSLFSELGPVSKDLRSLHWVEVYDYDWKAMEREKR
ncbi:MAG: hypothetical protein ACFFD4_36265 [Candidatus Odinarchaeota archaeon]